MQCNSCGSTLPPGARHCPNCGAPTVNTGPYQEATSPSPLLQTGSQPDRPYPADVNDRGPFQEAMAPPPPSTQQERIVLPGSYNPDSFQESASSPQPGSQPDRTMLAGPYTPPPASSSPNVYGPSAYPPPPAQPPYYAGSQQPPYA